LRWLEGSAGCFRDEEAGDRRCAVLQGVSLPGGDHQPRCLAYHRFPLSFCEVQEMILARGVVVSHETIRQWCAKVGQSYANGLRRRRACPGEDVPSLVGLG
jgi:hypothetical protein